MQIRTAQPAEYPAVSALTVRVYVDGGFTRPDSPYLAQLADAGRRAVEAELYVAVDGADRLLGAVTFAPPLSSYSETAGPGEAAFRMLVVDPAARGAGVGEALVCTCIDRARTLGCTVLRLSTQRDMTAAHRLYQRMGFHRTPGRDWEPMPGLHLLTFAMDLRGPAPGR